MSDSLERFRNVERWIYQDECIDSDPNGPLIDYFDFTALLAVAEEQQKEIDDHARECGLFRVTIGEAVKNRDEWMLRANAAEAKLAAMEEVVEAGRSLAEYWITVTDTFSKCGWCEIRANYEDPLFHQDDCPVGIVLSFTKNREAGR